MRAGASGHRQGAGVMTGGAVVFAYHNVGARCLRVLRAHGVDVRLVVTHEDDPARNELVRPRRRRRRDLGLPFIAPGDVEDAACRRPHRCARTGIPIQLLLPADAEAARCSRRRERGALNMHGSLLPKYRGRAPVNWAVLHGERADRRDAALHDRAARRRRHRRRNTPCRSCRTTPPPRCSPR